MGLLERARRNRSVATAVGVFGIAQALLIGVGLLNETTIAIAAYLMALAVGAVLIAVQLLRTSRVGRVVVVALSAALVVSLVVEVLPARAFVDLGRNVGGLVDELGSIAAAGGWAGLVLTLGLIRPWGEVFPAGCRWSPVAPYRCGLRPGRVR
ncbi:MAG TPA: hypothetical protein VFH02_08305 [Jiangellaceae bacterium]|nr:hypothetical protein [Jiangellaceae bacterium]